MQLLDHNLNIKALTKQRSKNADRTLCLVIILSLSFLAALAKKANVTGYVFVFKYKENLKFFLCFFELSSERYSMYI